MPQVKVTATASSGIDRCRQFLAEKNPIAAARAASAIERQFGLLEAHSEIGRPRAGAPELRELIIPFGASGYVALYRHVIEDDTVYILAFRHQKEAGY